MYACPKLFLVFLFLLSGLRSFAQRDTFSVYFPFNESALTEKSTFYLDSLIYRDRISTGQPVQIVGYADAVGKDTFNLRLSRQRAASVKAYLTRSGLRAKDITLIIGKGESNATAPEQPGGNLPDRRVDIITTRNIPPMVSVRMKTTVRPATGAGQPQTSPMDISSVPIGQTILLDKIYFYPGRHIVRPESNGSLNDLVAALQAHPEINIRIEGHVCCVPASYPDAIDEGTGREELSVNRAAVIRDYLIAHGIDKARLSFIGFGRRRPVIPVERNEDDANKNRRVEIRIVQ